MFAETKRKQRKALALCSGCPFKRECLTEGLAEEFGIWGGTTTETRRLARGLSETGVSQTFAVPRVICPQCGAGHERLDLFSRPVRGRWPEAGMRCLDCGFTWLSTRAHNAVERHRKKQSA